MVCVICEKSVENWFSSLCNKCRKIKHFYSLYNDRIYEILTAVLSRDLDKQKLKEADEIKKEIEFKQHNLRSKKRNKSLGDDSYTKPQT